MPEPISTTGTTAVAANLIVAASVTVFGVQLDIDPALLIAGLFGAIAGILLLNSVPSTGDTWRELLRTAWRRLGVVAASSVVAASGAPVAVGLVVAAPTTQTHWFAALVIGMFLQSVAPVLLERVKALAAGLSFGAAKKDGGA